MIRISSGRRSASQFDTLGAVLYRSGKFADAAQGLEEAIKADGKGGSKAAWLFLAMTRRRLGQTEEAKKCLARAQADFDKALPQGPGNWARRLELQILRTEAEQLLRGGGE